jgi:hypothetical protein
MQIASLLGRERSDEAEAIVKNASPKPRQFDSSPSQLVLIIFTRD